MKRLSDKEVEQYIKQALENTTPIEPPSTSQEMWKKIKEKEKRTKRNERLRQIPVYASSFIAVVAVAFFFLQVPETSDHLAVQNERKLADIDRAYEEIQTVTTMMKEVEEEPIQTMSEEIVVNDTPTYLPKGYRLVKEETTEEEHILTYEGKEGTFVLSVFFHSELKKEDGKDETKEEKSSVIEKTVGATTISITGDLPEEELNKIVDSMY